MPLVKDGRLIDDPWQDVADDAPLPAHGPVIVGLARWREDRDALIAGARPLGVRLDGTAGDAPDQIAGDIDRFELIALSFPKFTDGRGFSHARLLRERHGFAGELRATGHVLRDQLLAMSRCGFDAFEIADRDPVQAWIAALHEISVRYQPTGDGRSWAFDLRRRRRNAAPEQPAADTRRAPAADADRRNDACCAGDRAY